MSQSETNAPVMELTAFQRDLLAVVGTLDKPSGAAVHDAMQQEYGSRIAENRIYSNLDRLSDKGLIQKERDGRENVYLVTESGEQKIKAQQHWLQSKIANHES